MATVCESFQSGNQPGVRKTAYCKRPSIVLLVCLRSRKHSVSDYDINPSVGLCRQVEHLDWDGVHPQLGLSRVPFVAGKPNLCGNHEAVIIPIGRCAIGGMVPYGAMPSLPILWLLVCAFHLTQLYWLRFIYLKLKTCEASTSSQSRKPSQSCDDTSSQSCDDIINEAEDDDFDEPKSVNLHKRKRKCTIQEYNNVFVRNSELNDYCKKLSDLQSHHIEEDSQRVCHFLQCWGFL